MIYAALIAAAAALIGAAIASGDEAKAQQIRADLAKKIQDVPLPTLDKLIAQQLPPGAAERYTKSTQSTQAQSDILGKYMQEVNAKGETPDDRAAYLRMQGAANGIATGAQGAVQHGMATRGLAGSGLSFALQQGGAQNAFNAANEMGIKEAADARGRYMQALDASGRMAGSMRGQELQGLSAQDQINEFNARQQSDADRINQSIPQQNFDNTMSKQAAAASAQNGVAAGYERSAGATRETAAGVGNAALTAGATYDQYGNKIQKKDANGNPIP